MDLNLPAVHPVPLRSTHANAWSDQYGALQTAAAYAGVALPARYRLGGIWHHGCFGPWYEFCPELLVNFAPGAAARPVFTAREEQAAVLRGHGFGRVRAIGLPFVYAPESDVARVPGSLLVMPTHSLAGENHPDRAPFERYADAIARCAAGFRHVTVCVHPNCARNGLWVREFEARGFTVVYGAQNNDAHALRRMRTLFAAHETVTTNDWGSHVAYALAAGARLAIHGEPVTSTWRTFLADHTWAAHPDVLERTYSPEVLGAKREFLRRHYTAPGDAPADPALGRWLIGADQKVSPAAMREVLQTLVTAEAGETDFSETARQAQRERRAAQRAEAAGWVKKGRPTEAARLLLQCARAAADTRDPVIIRETLHEVAADLAPLDAAKAAILRGQAEKLSLRLAAVAA